MGGGGTGASKSGKIFGLRFSGLRKLRADNTVSFGGFLNTETDYEYSSSSA